MSYNRLNSSNMLLLQKYITLLAFLMNVVPQRQLLGLDSGTKNGSTSSRRVATTMNKKGSRSRKEGSGSRKEG